MIFRFYKIFLVAFAGVLSVILSSCGWCMAMPDHYYVFKGRISPPDSGITVYVSQGILTRSGNVDGEVKRQNSFVTNDSGYFIANVGWSHDCDYDGDKASDVIRGWHGLEVYVDHSGFIVYHDTLIAEDLDALDRISFEEAGAVRSKSYYHGVWVLPEITITPKP